jgi:glycosyltransferase involved in cell wall biosynthesis
VPRRRPGCARRPRSSRPLPGHRIAIDARAAARPEFGGVERWARELATRLPRLAPGRYEVLKPRPRLVHRAGHAWEQLILPARAAGAAALLCPANLAPLAHPRNVLVIHDAAALRHPEWYSPAYAAWQRRILPALARRALHVVTVSEFSRGELVELLDISPDRITVIPGGVDERFSPRADAERARRELGIEGPYVLCVASHTARKHLTALVPLADHVQVVVAGGHRPQFAREQGLERLRLLGTVPDELLPGLYAGADVFALPSLYEGFGLPVLEAMACGTPVVVADTSALRETAGGAARVVPAGGSGVAAAVDAVLADGQERARLRAAGLERAKGFTWDRTAREVDALLSALTGAPPPGTPRATAP